MLHRIHSRYNHTLPLMGCIYKLRSNYSNSNNLIIELYQQLSSISINHPDAEQSILRVMDSTKSFDAEALNKVIRKLNDNKKYLLTDKILETITLDHPLINDDTLCGGMVAAGTIQKPSTAKRMFDKLQNGVRMNVPLYFLVHAYCVADRLELVEGMLFQWLESIKKLNPNPQRSEILVVNGFHDNMKQLSFRSNAKSTTARTIFEEQNMEQIASKYPLSLNILFSLTKLYSRRSAWKQCLEIVHYIDDLQKLGQPIPMDTIELSHPTSIQKESASNIEAYISSVVDSVCLNPFHLLESFQKPSIDAKIHYNILLSSIYHYTLFALCKADQYSLVLDTIAKMKRTQPILNPQSSLIIYLLKSFHSTAASNLYPPSIQQIGHCQELVLSLKQSIIDSILQPRDNEEVNKALAAAYIRTLCKLDLIPQAEELLKLLVHEKVEIVRNNPPVIASLVEAYKMNANWNDAIKLYTDYLHILDGNLEHLERHPTNEIENSEQIQEKIEINPDVPSDALLYTHFAIENSTLPENIQKYLNPELERMTYDDISSTLRKSGRLMELATFLDFHSYKRSMYNSIQEELWKIFTFYGLHGDATQPELLRCANFVRFSKDCQIISNKLTISAVELEMTRMMRRKANSVDNNSNTNCLCFAEFLQLLDELSLKVYPDDPIEVAMKRLILENILLLANRRNPTLDLFDVHNTEAMKLVNDTFHKGIQNIFNYYLDKATKRRNQAIAYEKTKLNQLKTTTNKDSVMMSSAINQTILNLKKVANSQKDLINYKEYIQFCQDFALKSTSMLTPIQVGEVYLNLVPLDLRLKTESGMDQNTFCVAIVYLAHIAFRDSHAFIPPENKVKAILLYMWKAVNDSEKTNRYISTERVTTATSYAGSLNIYGSAVFSDAFLAYWLRDGFPDYTSAATGGSTGGYSSLDRMDPSKQSIHDTTASPSLHPNHKRSTESMNSSQFLNSLNIKTDYTMKSPSHHDLSLTSESKDGDLDESNPVPTSESNDVEDNSSLLKMLIGLSNPSNASNGPHDFRSNVKHEQVNPSEPTPSDTKQRIELLGPDLTQLFLRRPELTEFLYLEIEKMREDSSSWQGVVSPNLR